MKVCESCGESVRWGVTTQGARMPLNVAPASLGNVWVRPDGRLRVLNADEAARAREAGYVLHLSHHATCEHRGRHAVPRSQMSLELYGGDRA